MIGRVLLATDLSPACEAAAKLALHLVRGDPARVLALHATSTGSPAQGPVVPVPGRVRAVVPDTAAAQRSLDAWCASVGLAGARTLVAEGEPATQILDHARAERPDLLLLGVTGRGRIARALLGTTATRVLEDAPCDAIVARPREGRATEVRRILVASDFSPSAEAAAASARVLAEATGAELLAMHVRDSTLAGAVLDPLEAEPRLGAFARERLGPHARTLLDEGPPATVLREAARTHDVDLIAVGNRGMSNLPRLLMGGIARAVVEEAPCSVLVARRRRP